MELKATSVSKRFMRKSGEANYFEAVRPCDMCLRGGEVTVLMGRSGSGKTTLLTMLAGLLTPSTGNVELDGRDIYALSDRELSFIRASRFAVLPQGTGAIGSLTAMENILLPVSLAGKNADADLKKRISFLMEALGISQIENAFPKELSGGELRRMAIVRALCLSPDFIFADEPTGDLDDENTRTVLSLLKDEATRGAAVMMVSHEQEAARFADRLFYMNAGELSLRQ